MPKLTVAELKRRLAPGTRLRLTHTLLGPCDKLRVVAKHNSVDCMFTGDGIAEGHVSHLPWPKASCLHETPDGFEIWEEESRTRDEEPFPSENPVVSVRYVFLNTDGGSDV